MASMRDIKRRKQSIQSTGQITKAMKLVSTVKLQKSKTKADQTKPYFKYMYAAMCEILSKSGNIDHPYLKGDPSKKKGIIVISSNRGLAGGYNSNIVKLVMGSDIPKEDCVIYAVGRKGKEALARRGYEVAEDYSEAMGGPIFDDAIAIGRKVIQDFNDGKIGSIYLAYTDFKNTVSHIPTFSQLLPVSDPVKPEEEEDDEDKLLFMNFEPEAEEAFSMIIPLYVNSMIYGGLMQAFASENGARMQAMDSATNNATEMISDLTLKFNRARQSAITQEITEIVGGANAIS
ncbi:MAG: ATP synthase F1 subunit gamma [Lachnospiraceae bacterium]|nr:ATP synthase F1 subunit gamma [Lachnospiraceae bacterium]